MNRITLLVAGALVSLGTAATHAQTIDCACASTYSVGDRVTALVDNPASANGIAAGTQGTVICGLNGIPGLDILVRWDNFSNGVANNADSCTCPAPNGGGTNADWYVACTEVALVTPVRNVTQSTAFPTIQAAIDAANNGDTIEIDPVTIFEDGIVAPDGLNVTIRGADKDQTIIDGMGNASQSDAILAFMNSTNVVISDLTFRNGFTTTQETAAALQFMNTSITCRNVDFIDNNNASGQLGGAHVFARTGTCNFVNCSFRDGTAGDAISLLDGIVYLEQCLLVRPQSVILQASNTPATLLNCTVAGVVRPVGSLLTLANSAVDESIALQFGGTLSASRSLFPGATGNNIEGRPTFVDAMNGDYRLAAGSLGIDAANLNLYSSAGGGFIDLAGAPRVVDDLNTSDTGTGSSTALDIGAFEFQGASTPSGTCPGDANGDGSTSTADITFVVSNLGCTSN